MIYLIVLLISAVVSALWVQGIDTMKVSGKDYRGMDLFDEYDAQ